MTYRNFIYIVLLFLLSNCTTNSLQSNKSIVSQKNLFSNKGFTLVYDVNLYNDKIITKKLDQRSLVIFQKNLRKNSHVKITNILNNKSILATVGKNASYPSFNNSVISTRIANEIDLNLSEPYIEIISIPENSVFFAKRAKTFDEEKNVANKVPVNTISINDLNNKTVKNKKIIKNRFSYKIKIADFYFNKTALLMIKRIVNETKIKNPKIKKISNKEYRVFLGPFSNINSLQKSFNDVSILGFENLEIIKND
jgi:hypothetical protein